MYISALSIPTSIVSQFLAGIPVVILSLSGFTANSTNGDDDSISNAYSWNVYCVWIIRISSTFVVSMFIFVAYYVLRDYGLNTQVAEQMNKVNQRREDKSDADENEAAETRKTEAKGTDSAALEAANIEVDLSEAALMAIRETEVDGEIIQVTDDERQLLLHFSVAELYRIYAAIDSSVYKSSQGLPLIQTLLAFGCVEAFLTELVLVVAIALDNKNFGNSFSTLLIYFLVLVAFYILYEASRYVAIARVSKWKPHDLKLRAKAVYLEFSRKADTLQHLLAKEGINPDGSVDVDMISQWAGLRPSSLLGKNADEKELEEEAFVNLSGYKRIFSAIGAIAIFCIALIVIGNAK